MGEAVKTCSECPLYGTRAAGTRGPVDSRICAVGEAPGANELRDGIPWIGEAGKLLGKVLARAGIDESSVYLTNAMRCRPPLGKAPGSNFITACQPRLHEEVASHPRNLVLAFGNSAVRSLTGKLDAKITIERGRARKVTVGLNGTRQEVLLVPTYHPAAILRSPGDLPKLLDDVKYASGLVKGLIRPRDPGVVEYTIVSERGARLAIDFLLNHGGPFACDIETSGFNPRRDRVLCLSVTFETNRSLVFPDTIMGNFPGLFHRFFRSAGPFVGHNWKFDASYLRTMGFPARTDDDTMLMHYLLSEGNREPHGLKELSADLLGADPDYDKPVKSFAPKMTDSFASVPRPILYRYAAMDTDHTFQLYNVLKTKLHTPRYRGLVWPYENIMIPASRLLQEVERYGVWVHKPTVVQLSRELETELYEREQVLDEVAVGSGLWDAKDYTKWKGASKPPKEFNPGSTYQLRYIFHKMGIEPRDPKTKKASTGVPALKALPAEVQRTPFVQALFSRSKVAKLLGTYVDGIWKNIDTDGRVHSTYLLHGTATGRLSSRNPNMQNVPREARIRDIFQAPPGRILIELDYSQVELRVLAYLSDDEALKRVYFEGRDLHDEVSEALFPGWHTYKDTVRGREERIRAKFVNFGIAYGRGAESIMAEFKTMSFPEAKSMINGWWATFPDANRYVQECRAASRSGHPLETPFGRRRSFSLITSSNRNALENEAANFPIQSTASDLTLLSAIELNPQLVPLNAHIINLVHDSLLIECDPGSASKVAALSREVMMSVPEYYLQTSLPFEVSAKAAQSWGALK